MGAGSALIRTGSPRWDVTPTRSGRSVTDRLWAVEGCNGIGHHVAVQLLAAGEQVVDVPPKLSARARVFATGQDRKTDATDAHSVALVGTRMAGLAGVVDDEQLAVLRVLADRRRSLSEDHTRMTSQLHHLLLELIPGGAKKDLSAAQAKTLLAKVRPRDVAGNTRRRVAAELIADLERIHIRKKAADKELRELVASTGHRSAGPARHRPFRCSEACWSRSATSPCSPTAATTTARKPTVSPRWKPCDASSADCPTSSRRRRRDGPGRAPGQRL